ncbi:MAG: glycosyltransferase family 2 protein [Fimbriimonadaceae bacterium]
MRISAIVVSYNTCDLLLRCLESLGEADEIIVVDNASTDGSADAVARAFPSAILVRNRENVGFGRANNQGLDAATGDCALLLNSDAFATPGAIPILLSALEQPGVVAVGGLLFTPPDESAIQESACSALTLWAVFCEQTGLEKAISASAWLSPYWQSRRLVARGLGTHEVEQVMGACLAFRPVERFDDRFFLYCEDTELCKRLRRHGKILYVPRAKFGHELGASSSSDRWRSVARYNRGKELYFRIHGSRADQAVCWVFDRAGAFARLVAHCLMVGRGNPGLWWRVLFAPIGGPKEG